MPASGLALQKAIHQALAADAALLALLGGPKVHDVVPRGTAMPYVAIAIATVRDASTDLAAGDEHALTLQVWSGEPGLAQCHEATGLIRAALHDRALVLDGHRLVNLRHEASEVRREADGVAVRGSVRLRALTEPII